MARPVDPSLRPAIIAAALERFASHGFAASTIGDIAAMAKVGKGTVYVYFETKEDLLLEAVLHHCQLARAKVDQAMGGAGGWSTALPTEGSVASAEPDRALHRLVRNVLAVIPAAGQPHVRLFVDLWSASRSKPELLIKAQGRLTEMYVQWETLVSYLVMAGQARGLFRPGIDGRALARWFTATVDGLIWQFAFRADAAPGDLSAALADAMLAGLLADARRLAEVRA